jgi:tetratricopeptide (TPR) repeat protein
MKLFTKSLFFFVLSVLTNFVYGGSYTDSLSNQNTFLFNSLNEKEIFKNTRAKNFIITASSFEQNSQLSAAEKYYRLALVIYAKNNNQEECASTALRLSHVLLLRKKYTDAVKYSNRAVKEFEDLGLKYGSASAYLQLAIINRKTGNYGKAESFILKQALPLFRSVGNTNGRLRCFDNLGHIYLSQKRYPEAKWFFLQQNTLSRTLGDTASTINSLYNLGKVKTNIKHYKLAVADFKEAESLAKQAGSSGAMKLYINKALTRVYSKIGKPSIAKKAIVQGDENSQVKKEDLPAQKETQEKKDFLNNEVKI